MNEQIVTIGRVKVRLQTTKNAHFRGPIDCVTQTVRNEGIRGFYKGMTPPLVGWVGLHLG